MTQFKPSGRKIAVIATNGLEQSGLTWREANQGPDQQELWGDTVTVAMALEDAQSASHETLILPGGV
jgi:hypothetical protein